MPRWIGKLCCQSLIELINVPLQSFDPLKLLLNAHHQKVRNLVELLGLHQRLAHRQQQLLVPLEHLHINEHMYKWRHLIENFFGKLKKLNRITMRSYKTDSSFTAAIYLSFVVINSR